MTDQLADGGLEGATADRTPATAAPTDDSTPRGALVSRSGERFELTGDNTLIGRLVDCTIVLADRNVSRRHARIRRDGEHFTLTDLGSTNGTDVNGGLLIGSHLLADGDVVTLGTSVLEFVTLPAEPAATDADTDTDTDTDTATATATDTATDTDTDTDTGTATGTDTDTATDTGAETGSDATVPTRQRRARVSRWDRPPEPHDWRYVVGAIGKILIVTGLMLFGFVAYQLWGTGLETARSQGALKDEFAQLVAEQLAAPAAPDAVTPTIPTEPLAEPSTDDTPDVGGEPSGQDRSADRVDGQTVVTIPPIEPGQPLALLEIPAIGRSDVVVPGISHNDLKKGPGHYPTTPLPGQLGNAAIAGHRTTYGAPFFDVDKLQPGDELIVTMFTGAKYVYVVTGSEIVGANDGHVIATTDPTIAELTLTSCHPKYTARDRIIIHSVLDPDRSAPLTVPATTAGLAGDSGQPIPGDDPVVATTVAAPPATVPDATVPDATVPDATVPDATVPDATVPDATVPDATIDGLTDGWFADREAFPQVALWGAALVAVALAARAVSHRYRRYWLGFLVGTAPFVVSLYFFYQNVNRLLPPGV